MATNQELDRVAPLSAERHQEWHITVKGDPFEWRRFCHSFGIKPLWIELSNFDRHLMCAIDREPIFESFTRILEFPTSKFEIIRIKHEVMPDGTEQNPIYYECHVKLDGTFLPYACCASRDLFRDQRWYQTLREPYKFDPKPFVDHVRESMGADNQIVGVEYEVALTDTNPLLDAGWITKFS